MEGFDRKDKKFFLFFEFLGMVILTISFNMVGQLSFAGGDTLNKMFTSLTLFIVSLMSWEISCAHFNTAITIGSYIYEGQLKKNLPPFLGIVTVQILGCLCGIFMTWYLS